MKAFPGLLVNRTDEDTSTDGDIMGWEAFCTHTHIGMHITIVITHHCVDGLAASSGPWKGNQFSLVLLICTY